MTVYYIDDSFFGKSDYARDMLYKLKVVLEEENVRVLLISTHGKFAAEIERLRKDLAPIEIIESPNTIQNNSNTLYLTPCGLKLKDQEVRCYSGTYCIVNLEDLSYKRIYLNLFPQEETSLVSLIEEQIRTIIESKRSSDKLKS